MLLGKPMLLKDAGLNVLNLKSAINNEKLCIQQKIDGQRILVSVCENKVTYYTRNGDTLLLNGGYHSYFTKYTEGEYIFDGELTGGVLWLFDLVDLSTPKKVYKHRLKQLNLLINPTKTVKVLPTATSTLDKLSLVKSVIKSKGEGVVLKNLDESYGWDKRIGYKFKFYNDIDVFAISEHPTKNAIEIGVFDNEHNIVDLGSVKREGVTVQNSVFLVKYLYATTDNKLYQPSIIRRRTDKDPEECFATQLRYTNKEVLDHKKIFDLIS